MANHHFTRPINERFYPGGQDWELGGMDPRLDEYYSNTNHYNSGGPGFYLPPEQQAYSKRATRLPFKIFISGIHPQTTEEGISNIFSLYGNPLRVFKTRNKNNEPIGFVHFATQMEGDNAIIGLNGKPPLHWSVSYSLDHNRRDPEYSEQYADAGAGFYEELEHHTPMHPLPGMVPPVGGSFTRTFPAHVPSLGAQSLPNVRVMPSSVPSDSPCIICGMPAESAYCSKCKAPSRPASSTELESASGGQPSGQHRPQPASQKNPKKKGWLNNARNMKTSPMGNSVPLRAGSFPIKNASPKSAVTNGPLARISPLNRPRPDIYAKLFTVNKLSPLRNKPNQVIVRAATAPDNFFVQFLNFKEMLDKLTNELQLAAQNAPPLNEPVLENSPCLAMCPLNGKWLRAQILKVWDDAVGVSFVDYGHRKKLSKTPEYVRMMEHEFALKPFLAINVKLAEVLPLEGSDWSKEVKTFFNTLVEDKTLTMEFVQWEGDMMVVRLANSNRSDLGSYLVYENKAKRISKQQEITDELDRIHLFANKDSVVVPPPQVIYKTPQETAASRLVASKMASTSSQNAQTVVARTNVAASVNQSNPPVQRPSPPAVQSTTPTQSAASGSTMSTAPVLPRASALAGLLRKISASRFVANSVLDSLAPNDIAIFSAALAFNAGFAVGTLIRNEIDLTYEEFHTVVEGEPPVPNFKPSVGTKVAALSVAHGQYFRGCVTKSSGSSFTILYLDFGNNEDGVTAVKPSPSSFKVPELAVKFTPMSKEAERFAAQNISIDTPFHLEVVSAEKGQFAIIKLADFPDLQFKLEPWTALTQPMGSC